jgi:hypothetical protein
MNNNRFERIQTILNKNSVSYTVVDTKIITEKMPATLADRLVGLIMRFTPKESIEITMTQNFGTQDKQSSITIDVTSTRESILKALAGTNYTENYGVFTVIDSGDIYITEEIDDNLGNSLYDLISDENRVYSDCRYNLNAIVRCNQLLNLYKSNPIQNMSQVSFNQTSSERDEHIKNFEKSYKSLLKLRKELRECLISLIEV